jgi:hypothetical protein
MSHQQKSTAGRTGRNRSRASGRRTAGSLLAVMLLALLTGLGSRASQGHESTGPHNSGRSTVAAAQGPWNSTGS